MKKRNKSLWITVAVIAAVVVFALMVTNGPKSETTEEIAKCIGENSELYVQLGCRHCETQEKMFGENLKFLEKTDCFFENEICNDKQITATPTWIINGQKYQGVQEIARLQELTGC